MSTSKRNDIAIVVACIFGFFAAWFGVPAGFQAWKSYDLYRSRSVAAVALSPEQKKEHEDAIADIKKAITNSNKQGNPSYANQYRELGTHYEALGYLGRAAGAFARASKEGGETTELLMDLARVHQEMKYFDKAAEFYRSAIDRDPGRTDTYQKLAELYHYDLGDSARARGIYIEGLNKTGNSLHLMKLFANFLELSGYRHEAYLYWDAVLKKDRGDKTVEAKLKNLEDVKASFD